MDEFLIKPIKVFISGIQEVKSKRKRFEKFSSHYQSVLSKASQAPKQKQPEVDGILVQNSKRDLLASSLDFMASLHEVKTKKKFELLDRTNIFMFGNLAYFQQGHQIYNLLSPFMQELSKYTQKVLSKQILFLFINIHLKNRRKLNMKKKDLKLYLIKNF